MKRRDAESQTAKEGSCVPARYVLALMAFTGITLQYMLKVNLSVAIVAMVKIREIPDGNVPEDYEGDVCPKPADDSSSVTSQDGEFDWDESMQGIVLSSYYYGYVATQLIGGRLSETIGSKLVFGPGVFLTGVFTLLSPVAAQWHVGALIAVRILEGAASGVVIPSMHFMFTRWFPPAERQKFSGIVFSSIYLGSMVSMALSGVLAAIDWTLVFYFFGGMAVVWYIPWVCYVYDSPETHPSITAEEREYILSGLGPKTDTNDKGPVPWLKIFTSLPVWAGITMHTSCAWVLYTLLSELPTYSKNILHFDIKNSGLVSALPYLFCAITTVCSGILSQWLQDRKYLSHLAAYRVFNGIPAVGQALALLAITLVGCDRTAIVILFTLTMAANGVFYGGSYLNHIDLASNYAGTISGILHTFVNAPGILTPLVTGALTQGQQTLSQWKIVFYISAIIAGVPYLFYLIFGSVEEQPWNRNRTANSVNLQVVSQTDLKCVEKENVSKIAI